VRKSELTKNITSRTIKKSKTQSKIRKWEGLAPILVEISGRRPSVRKK
jgi:hypothetical protein